MTRHKSRISGILLLIVNSTNPTMIDKIYGLYLRISLSKVSLFAQQVVHLKTKKVKVRLRIKMRMIR